MSFFSKKTPLAQGPLTDSNLVIKTMQDDLNAIDGSIIQEEVLPPKPLSYNGTVATPAPTPVRMPTKTQPLSYERTVPVDSQPPNTNQNPFMTQDQPEQNTPSQNYPAQSSQSDQDSSSPISIQGEVHGASSRKAIVSMIIIIVLLLIGGAFYFIKTRSLEIGDAQKPSVTSMLGDITTLFSTKTANYLPVDAASATPESMQAILLKTAKDASSISNEKVIEFIVTDTSNNPLSFASFAKIANIKLSQATADSIGEKFSLFIYTHNNTPRLGLIIDIKDASMLQKAIRDEESTLIEDFSPLLLGDTPQQSAKTFTDGSYKNIPLRYINLDPVSSLSMDYALNNQRLVIGTSMATHHALLDISQIK